MLVNMHEVCVQPRVFAALADVGLIIRPQTGPEANRCLEEVALDQSQ